MKRAITISAALVAFLGLASAPAALAVSGPPHIPEGTTGSLTVHKFEQPTLYGPDNQGMELPEDQIADLVPFPGVTFTVRQVTGVDLTVHTGWQIAQQVVDNFDPFTPEGIVGGELGWGEERSEVTGSDGGAAFTDLPVGLYLVEETGVPPVASNSAVTGSMPFLITVPLTHPLDTDRWVFDVHVYPKNVLSTVTKTVIDSDMVAVGETMEYPITASIPGGSVTTAYSITDQLDPRLSYESSTVTIGGKATTDVTAVEDDGLVTVTLGHSAREAAFAAVQADANAVVEVRHTVTVNATGEIPNDATLIFQRKGEWETEVPSTPVVSKIGGITVLKHNRDKAPLAGATFEVHASHTNDFASATAVTVEGISSWTTGADGKVAIDGLRYSAWANGASVSEESGKYNFYWLVETKAPAGYELLPQPIPFVVDAQIEVADVIEVVNTPHNAGGTLPLTGAQGSAALMVLGLVLVGAGGSVFTAVRRSTKRGSY